MTEPPRSTSTPARPRHAAGAADATVPRSGQDVSRSGQDEREGRRGHRRERDQPRVEPDRSAGPVDPAGLGEESESVQPETRATQDDRSGTVPPIVIDALGKEFGRPGSPRSVRAVDNLSFTVTPGRITGFLGPNGAGKSTTLRILLGLAQPTVGSATFGGVRYRDLPNPQQRVGAVLEPSFHPGRSGRDHLRTFAITAGVDNDRVEAMLTLVGLADAADRRVGGYSLGMRQRLALATALLGEPDYLILDEPANGLDPEGIRWLRGFLRAYAAGGRVVLMSSHILNEVEATVDDVVVIGRGKLIRQSPMRELAAERRSSKLRVADQRAAGAVLDRIGLTWQPVTDEQGDYLRVQTTDLAPIGTAMFDAGLPVLELSPTDVDLEAEFFAMLGDQQ